MKKINERKWENLSSNEIKRREISIAIRLVFPYKAWHNTVGFDSSRCNFPGHFARGTRRGIPRIGAERRGSLLRPREFVLIARTIVKVDNAIDRHTCSALRRVIRGRDTCRKNRSNSKMKANRVGRTKMFPLAKWKIFSFFFFLSFLSFVPLFLITR